MENLSKQIGRRLPPELLAEIHKCLPLADAINVLVNVPTRAIYQNNSPRMRRTIQRIKTSLNEFIETLDLEDPRMIIHDYDDEEEQIEEENDRAELKIFNYFEWKPQFDALLRYGAAMTSSRSLYTDGEARIVGIPKNFIEELLLNLANSSSPQMMLPFVYLEFEFEEAIFPPFLKQLFNKKEYRIENNPYIFYDFVELKTEDGRILRIHSGEMYETKYKDEDVTNELKFVVVNKMNWFEILMIIDNSKKSVKWIEFTRWKMQPFDGVENFENTRGLFNGFIQNGEQVESKENIHWCMHLDRFIRYGARFTKFRHMKIKHAVDDFPDDYATFLISFIGNTKRPEEFLESIEMSVEENFYNPSIHKIWNFCSQGIPEDGTFMKLNKKKLHILTAKTTKFKKKGLDHFGNPKLLKYFGLEFTLANIPTNGDYLFDVRVQFERRTDHILELKIQRRKMAEN